MTSYSVRYFVYCFAISVALVYAASGGQITGVIEGRIAAGITCVLWLACMAARLLFGRARCARSRSAG